MSTLVKEKLRELEMKVNNFFVDGSLENRIIIENLYLFYKFSGILEDNLPKYEEDEKIDYSKITKRSVFENIDLVKKFYDSIGISVNFESLIQDGTIDFFDDCQLFTVGFNYFENGKKLIDCCNKGLVSDSVVLLHEVSHYRNQPDGNRQVISDLLTETISMTEEQFFLDFLIDLGYLYEADIIRKHIYNSGAYLAEESTNLFLMLNLYKNMSSISRDSYEFFFGTDEGYEEYIESLEEYFKYEGCIIRNAWYVLAYNLSIYLYLEYKKDPFMMNNIQTLHSEINNGDMFECLKLMNLTDLGDEDRDRIAQAISIMKNKLNEGVNKRILNK